MGTGRPADRGNTTADRVAITAEADDVVRRLAPAMRAGITADHTRAMDVAEDHRQHISRWFCDCPPRLHAAVGRMYVEGQRLPDTYERVAPGLAQSVSAAGQADAAGQGS